MDEKSARPATGLRGKIFLIGYRACGKTAVGKLLASRLGWRFTDMDREIRDRCAMSIKEMVARQGWDHFRERERQLLQELSRQPPTEPGTVVATGGGAVLQQDLWAEIKAAYPVIWLTADPATIAARISADTASDDQRPSLTDQGLLGEISEVLEQRQELYRRAAHRQMDTTTRDPSALVADIIDWLNGRHGDNT